jgi:hypothetical protein
MDITVVGFGPAYECRAESLIGDRDWPLVNAVMIISQIGSQRQRRWHREHRG